ncbi:MAG: LptF/LptG family permease, partial [Gemmatimonadota bacterium]
MFAAETVRVGTVGPGLVHRYYWAARGPWAIHLLDVDRAACWSVVALKAGGVSTLKILSPVLFTGLLISFFIFLINEIAVPKATVNSTAIMEGL